MRSIGQQKDVTMFEPGTPFSLTLLIMSGLFFGIFIVLMVVIPLTMRFVASIPFLGAIAGYPLYASILCLIGSVAAFGEEQNWPPSIRYIPAIVVGLVVVFYLAYKTATHKSYFSD